MTGSLSVHPHWYFSPYAVPRCCFKEQSDALFCLTVLTVAITLWLVQYSVSPVTDFLREDTMIGTSFLRVAAHDDDFGTNAAMMYSMSGEQPEYLRVNPLTGWVYVNQPISQVEDFYWHWAPEHLVLNLEIFFCTAHEAMKNRLFLFFSKN